MSKADLTWNLSQLYVSDDDPAIEADLRLCEEAYSKFESKWRATAGLAEDAALLLQALTDWEELASRYGYDGKPGYYFRLRSSQDVTSPAIRARLALIADTAKKNADRSRFFPLLLGQTTAEQQQRILADKTLAHFHPYLRQLFAEARHNLSEGEERVFSYLIEPAYGKWAEMIEGFLASEVREVVDENGQTIQAGYGDLDRFLTSPHHPTRLSAIEATNSILTKHVAAAENELNAILETKKASDQLRGFAQPESERLLADMIDQSSVDAMAAAVSERFDLSGRFYQLKSQLLGQPKLLYGERNVGIGDLDADYSFDRSCAVVQQALGQLDPEFAEIFQDFSRSGNFDVYPRSGKRSGAFCAYDRIDLPTYILLSHTDTLRDLATLAHEVGHGINDELIKKSQTALYAATPLSTAEVASTFMEDFALREATKDLSDKHQLAVITAKLNDDVATIFRQVAAYSFERELHARYRSEGYLSKEVIGDLFQKHMSLYLGDSVEFDASSQAWWVGWHHFRRPFYVYSYASGLLISKSLQAKTRKNPAFIRDVKKFLSAGMSATPKEIFSSLGIDITDKAFWRDGLAEVERTLNEAERLTQAQR